MHKKWVRKSKTSILKILSCNSLLNSKADFINKHLISFGILEDTKNKHNKQQLMSRVISTSVLLRGKVSLGV